MLSVFACLCVCFFSEAASIRRALPEILPINSGDVIMKEDAEEMFYNVNLEKYDGGCLCYVLVQISPHTFSVGVSEVSVPISHLPHTGLIVKTTFV